MSIDRYNPTLEIEPFTWSPIADMEFDPDGDWVSYEDFKRHESEAEKLKAELESAQNIQGATMQNGTKLVTENEKLRAAINDALYGEPLDLVGNRDDNGFNSFPDHEFIKRRLQEVTK